MVKYIWSRVAWLLLYFECTEVGIAECLMEKLLKAFLFLSIDRNCNCDLSLYIYK